MAWMFLHVDLYFTVRGRVVTARTGCWASDVVKGIYTRMYSSVGGWIKLTSAHIISTFRLNIFLSLYFQTLLIQNLLLCASLHPLYVPV
jgi:hypothetical protein